MAARVNTGEGGTGVLARPAAQSSASYTLSELMVCAAAREIRGGELVFVGMRLPLIAFVVAKRTHAPNAIGLFENGVIRSTPAPELIYTMADPPNLLGATQCLDMLGVMGLLQSGRVDLGFLGAAEVDRFGNLNSTQVNGPNGIIRLPGSGGACDIASLAQRFVVLLEHKKERLPERVSFVTSPAITTKAVLRFNENGEAYLDSVHPGVEVDDVVENTGWKLKMKSVQQTPEPSQAELTAIREYDKEGFWTK
jgi:glutaconate CoA-transferase subunit B